MTQVGISHKLHVAAQIGSEVNLQLHTCNMAYNISQVGIPKPIGGQCHVQTFSQESISTEKGTELRQ